MNLDENYFERCKELLLFSSANAASILLFFIELLKSFYELDRDGRMIGTHLNPRLLQSWVVSNVKQHTRRAQT